VEFTGGTKKSGRSGAAAVRIRATPSTLVTTTLYEAMSTFSSHTVSMVASEAGMLPEASRRTMRQSMVLLKPWTKLPPVLVTLA